MTKTKKRSRFFAVALVAVLMLALAVPSYAASSRTLEIPAYEIVSIGAGNRALNIERSYSGNLHGTTNVTVYTPTESDDQNWWHNPTINSTSPILSHVLGPANELYAINFFRTTPRNCVVYPYDSINPDSQIYFWGNAFMFTDNGADYYMTVTGNANNANVYWQQASGISTLGRWVLRR